MPHGKMIALLRGINVGGNRKLPMEALRARFGAIGFQDVQTYIQSGNVIFSGGGQDAGELRSLIEAEIQRRFGFHVDVILRTAAELQSVIERNPFAGRPEIAADKLLVSFLAADPGQQARDRIAAMEAKPEELRADGRELYIFFPNGMGRSKLPMSRIEKLLATPSTGRNWNTVLKLHELAR